jgi:RimJ/RimL family protein N-acetyltransferase
MNKIMKINKLLSRFNKFNNQVKKYIFYIIDEPDQIILPQINSEYRLNFFDNENISRVAEIRDENILEKFRYYLSQNHVGVFLSYNNKIIAYGWMSLNENQKSIKTRNFYRQPPNSAYIFSCYTSPEFRKQSLYTYIIAILAKIALKKYKNISQVAIDTNSYNIPAQKGIIKAGFQEKFELIIVMILGVIVKKRIFYIHERY